MPKGLGSAGVFLARGFGPAAFALLLLALLGLLLGFDLAPGELQGLGDGLQRVEAVVSEVGDGAADRVRQLLGRKVEPQGEGVAAPGLGLDDHPFGRNAVEAQFLDARVRRIEVEHGPVAARTLALREHLAAERHVGEHAQVELRLGRGVAPHGVVPDCEVGQLGRVAGFVEEAHAVHGGVVELVAVRVLEGVDAVGYGLQVLGDEDAVVLGARDDGRTVEVERGVVLGRDGRGVGGEEPQEAPRHRVGLVGVGRIARADHRVDLAARGEDVAHGVERVALVVVADGRTEVERVGGIGGQRVAQLHHDAAAAHRKLRFPAHGRGGEELFLLVLELHELVELDVDLRAVGHVRGEVVGRHGHDHRGQRILGASGGAHHAGAPDQEGREEEQRDGAAEQSGEVVFTHGMRRYFGPGRSRRSPPPACHRVRDRRVRRGRNRTR